MESLESLLGCWQLYKTDIQGYSMLSETLEFRRDGTLTWTVVWKENAPPNMVHRRFEVTPEGYQHRALQEPSEPVLVKCAWDGPALIICPPHGHSSWFRRSEP